MIQQMLVHLGFSAMYDMSHSTKSIGYHFYDVDKRPESTVGQGSVLRTVGLLL